MFVFENTDIEGLKVIYPKKFLDNRGQLKKVFEKKIFMENGIELEPWEELETTSHKGVLRGIHLQLEHSQAKLIRVARGKIYDVAVDLRKDSITFGKYFGIELSEENCKMLYIPEGFGHGCLILEENTTFYYLCSSEYIQNCDSGISYNDPELNITWPQIGELIISDKDKNLPSFSEYKRKVL